MLDKTNKFLAVILLISIPLFSFCQEENTNKEIEKIVEVPEMNKANLYSNALSFFANNFKSANDVIQMKDETSGKVIGKGIVKNGNANRNIKIAIDVKDNKYRYTITIEPFIELKKVELEDINKIGSVKGKTFIRYGYVNGALTIDKDNSYIECIGQFSCNGEKYYYSGKNEILGLSKKAKEEWQQSVDNKISEVINELEINPTNKEDSELINLIKNLENEMSKKDDW
ncbi:MAG: DUF4468 domain-containing protein [Brumimicrobium sp.]|nr:DUF4468 domain-containing protein [Brumimicrobium sp.]